MEIRRGDKSKSEFLDELYNRFGDTELSIAYSYESNGEHRFSKWIKWEKLMSMNDDEILLEVHPLTKKRFVEIATHRSVLDVELLFDVDDEFIDKRGLNKWVYPTIFDKANHIFNCLKNEGKNPVMCSANRGFHISVIVPDLRELSYGDRRDFKAKILSYYDCDVQKANKCLISMEGEKHFKSGKVKEEVKN